jgi:hypothetical protein
MIDVILASPNGVAPSLVELSSRGFSTAVRKDAEHNIVGLSYRFNPITGKDKKVLPEDDPDYIDPLTVPALSQIRAHDYEIEELLAETWAETVVLAKCQVGGERVNYGTEEEPEWVTETLLGRLAADPVALGIYLSYPEVQVPEFNADGSVNIQFHKVLDVEIDGKIVLVPNPHYQPFLALGHYL